MDELLRAAPGMAILLFCIGAFVIAAGLRSAHRKMIERNLASNAKLEELRRRQIDILERIAVALESNKDQGRSG